MKIAVVIPCHNAAAWLGQTLGCLLDQTRVAEQIVVVDDASTDGSRAIAEAFASWARSNGAAELFTLVSNDEPGSASRARNTGYAQLRGEIDAVMFLDADDVLAPDTLAALVEGLEGEIENRVGNGSESCGGGGIALCPWVRLEYVEPLRSQEAGAQATEAAAGRWESRPMSAPARPAGVSALDAWLTGWYHPPCAVLWSRRRFESTAGWDPTWCVNDDGDLMLRALVEGLAGGLVDRAEPRRVEGGMAYYRRLPQDQTSLSDKRSTPAGLGSRLRVLKKIGLRLEQSGQIDDHRAALAQACWRLRREAAEPAPQVAQQAEQLGQRWQPTRGQRLRARLLDPRGNGPGFAAYPETPPPFEPQTITHGLARAAQVMANAALRQPPPPRFSTPPPRPRVSVIVPTHNRPDASVRAIRSVLDQTFADFELLVIDDASSDDTAERCEAVDDPRVTLHRQPINGGVARARNAGMRQARGRYLAFLDSDDLWEPTKLARQVALLESLPAECGMVYCGMRMSRADGSERIVTPTHRGDLAELMLRENVILPGGSGPVMRRSALATVGFFDPRLPAIEDYDYWLRLAQLYIIDFVPEPLCIYDDAEPDGQERRSRHIARNIRAREMFFDKHQHALRRAGEARAFLWQTVDRCLRPRVTDAATARRLAWRALREQPTDPRGWRQLKWAWSERQQGPESRDGTAGAAEA